MADELCITIPKNAENLNLPDPTLVNFYKELERRTLWIDCEIDDGCLEIERYILLFNKEDVEIPIEERRPIKLMFFTPGTACTGEYENIIGKTNANKIAFHCLELPIWFFMIFLLNSLK